MTRIKDLSRKADFMKNVLAIDIAKNKSMVYLQSEFGEIHIDPFEIDHTLSDFESLKNRVEYLNLNDVTIFMESTSTCMI
ncbi:hypothetical protein RJG79_05290 [Mycoplasmatota bacterium WC44]